MSRVLLVCLIFVFGCGKSQSPLVPVYSSENFRTDVSQLIFEQRYDGAVEYLRSANPQLQADYDKTGFLAVGEDLIVLPGTSLSVEFNRDRDWEFPCTSDAIHYQDWQSAATEFSKRYNQHRRRK